MKIIDPGHRYELAFLDGIPMTMTVGEDIEIENVFYPKDSVILAANRLQFVKREGDGYPGNIGSHAGTTIQEVLRAIIDRVKYLDNQIHDDRNEVVIDNMRAAIYWLEERAAERHERKLPINHWHEIEQLPTCPKCLHIGCNGTCHP